MEDHAVPVLRVRDKAPTPRQRLRVWGSGAHISRKAAAIAMTVNPRLTQGPHRAAPAMIAIANSGKNDREKIRPNSDKYIREGRAILRSFLQTISCALYLQQGGFGSAWIPG